jgi:hypothetical protein
MKRDVCVRQFFALALCVSACATEPQSTRSAVAELTPSSPQPAATPVGPSCGPLETLCGPNCVSLATDSRHCGACGYACARSGGCVGGRCVQDPPDTWSDDPTLPAVITRCSSDRAACGDTCVDLLNDQHNCGSCGTHCTGGCSLGVCSEGGV